MMELKFDQNGLITTVVQDMQRNVLMVAYMNEESLKKTIETGETVFWSRSRNELWHKGETSGSTQKVEQILMDCDSDCLIVIVTPKGPACHTGEKTCFYRNLEGENEKAINSDILSDVYNVIKDRQDNPKEGSYTNYLLDQGIDKILKKVGEEAAETLIAAKNRDTKEVAYEMSDLLYHSLVMLVDQGMKLEDVLEELKSRR